MSSTVTFTRTPLFPPKPKWSVAQVPDMSGKPLPERLHSSSIRLRADGQDCRGQQHFGEETPWDGNPTAVPSRLIPVIFFLACGAKPLRMTHFVISRVRSSLIGLVQSVKALLLVNLIAPNGR